MVSAKKGVVPPNHGAGSLVDPGEQAIVKGVDLNPDLSHGYDEDDSPTRAAAAVSLRIAGAGYNDIAKTLGYSSGHRARVATERALADAGDDPNDREHLRVLIDRRLNRLLQSVMGKAVDGNNPDQLAFNRQALAIIDRQARLYGVDAPSQVSIITPSQERIAEYIGNIVAIARLGMEAEADILDAELMP